MIRKNMFNKNKAQGTIEYLIIVAIVIVIALVVVGILLQLMGQGTGITQTQSQISWNSAQPWGIVEWDHNTTQLTLVMQNNTSGTMDLNSVTINGTQSNEDPITNIGANGRVVITINKSCTNGTNYSYDEITIVHDSTYITDKVQTGNAKLNGTCHN